MVAAAIWQAVKGEDARLAEAYRGLRADPAIQFHLAKAPPPPTAPGWLRQLGHWIADLLRPVERAISWINQHMPDMPYVRILLWSVLAISLAGLIWLVVVRLRGDAWRWPVRRGREVDSAEAESWMPDAAPARAWLDEADALAARGAYAEAAHHLLLRSIEDIERRRPRLVRPALTSRDIAAEQALPPRARTIFSGIAALVERSLFGGRTVSKDDWGAARAAYADFALAKAWSA